MRFILAGLFASFAANCLGQSPEKATEQYFAALAESNKEQLVATVFEPSAERIGKSIIAAAPMFHRKGETEFLELIFDRVPEPEEIVAMKPVQAFAEYMCDPLPDDPNDITNRTVLGVVFEREDLAHVVYRVEGMPNLGETSRDIVTCIHRDEEWRVVVPSQVWEAYMNYTLQPAMAKLSEGNAEQPHAAGASVDADSKEKSSQ